MTVHQGVGPAITARAPILAEPDRILLENGMGRLIPKFHKYGEELKVLGASSKMPDPATASSSEPEVVDFQWEIPCSEPEIAFPGFIRGVAVCALGLSQEHHENIKAALMQVAENIMNGQELPHIDTMFENEVGKIEDLIVNNGEFPSWRSLMAFTLGAFWLLSHVKDPYVYADGQISPYEYVCRRITSSAQLGYIPI